MVPRGLDAYLRANPQKPSRGPAPGAPYARPRPQDVPDLPLWRALVARWAEATRLPRGTLVELHAHGCEWVATRLRDWLWDEARLPSEVVQGYHTGDPDPEGTHTWLLAELEGRWWLLDGTQNLYTPATGDPRPLLIAPLGSPETQPYRRLEE